ncbi:MAG: lipopolysaccharide heptosyltransferase II [candidate division KSB1 bacterium]|nr:lipopolysaccharide heptosyltransferase II [candidate division KSB1 bacterium]MDZ7304003.1 lipopolysaccharide heptosyltransferase II [candidate division KSB1 bacterium]MDZ7313287.1 lipopolysaccharide heptosyltransferase II [candidate division KSB1 bacterium]
MQAQKILIIRLSSIGDILLTTPLLRALRTSLPDAQLDFVVKANFAEVLRFHPAINHLYELNPKGGWSELQMLGRRLRERRYDVVIDLHKNFRSRYLARAAKPPEIFRYHKHVLRRWFFVKTKINLMRNVPPIYQRYLEAAAPLGIGADQSPGTGHHLDLFWSSREEQAAETALSAHNWQPRMPLLGLAPGAGYFTKRWPAEYFGELAAQVIRAGHQVVVVGGRQDVQLADQIVNIAAMSISPEAKSNLINLAGALSLLAAAVVIKHCRLVVANDSGLMHIAEAVGTPLIAIFGSTTRELGFFPQQATSRVVENQGLACRPCSHLGHAQCPRGHFRCMREILPEQIWAMTKQMAGVFANQS